MVKKNTFLAPLFLWGAILFFPYTGNTLCAQSKSQISASVYASSLFINTNDAFFDGTSLSITYSHNLADYIDGYIDLGALTAVEIKDEFNFGLDRFSIGLISLSAGVDLYLVEAKNSSFSVGVGAGLRNRKEVIPMVAIQLSPNENFTIDRYINKIDYGSLLQMKYSVNVSSSVSLGMVTRIHIYNDGNSVWDLGIRTTKHF